MVTAPTRGPTLRLRLPCLKWYASLHVATRSATLPNLRYIGIGPDPDQIISDVPATAELIK
jgi:hypothetical protein